MTAVIVVEVSVVAVGLHNVEVLDEEEDVKATFVDAYLGRQ